MQSLDGFSCIQPDVSVCGSTNQYQNDLEEDGTLIDQRRCISCNGQSSLLISNSCKSCRPFIFSESNQVDNQAVNCNQFNIPLGGFYFLTPTVIGQPNYFLCPFESNNCVSWYLKNYGASAFRTCRISSRRNRISCQQLANMCVLSLYSYGPLLDIIDVCKAYDAIYEEDSQNVPWLRYPESYGEYKANYLISGINSEFLKVP